MTAAARDAGLLTEAQIAEIERRYPNGITSRQVLDLFSGHGTPLSEATFRKYVQLGLLPRSRRVGRKGKFKGSQGIYPIGTVRRLNLIRRLMRGNLTLEQIQRSFRRFKDRIEQLDQALQRLLSEMEEEVRTQALPEERRRALTRELTATRRTARGVVRQLERLEGGLSQPGAEEPVSPALGARPDAGPVLSGASRERRP
jgi:DNA-binding transcriptional MerR regulator